MLGMSKLVGSTMGLFAQVMVDGAVSKMSPHLGHKVANKVVAKVAAVGLASAASKIVEKTINDEIEGAVNAVKGIVNRI